MAQNLYFEGTTSDNCWVVIFAAGELLKTFVPVIDRLIAPVKARDEAHQHLVSDIVAPYFDELQTSYTAYLGTLRKAKKMVEDGQSYEAVYSEVEVLRAADLILRDKVREMADAYRTDLISHDHVASFFGDASDLFGYWNGYHHSGTLRILTALKEGEGRWDREFLLISIAMTISAGEEQWRRLAKQYAHIQVKYLQPTKITAGQNHNAPSKTERKTDGWFNRLLNSIRTLFPPPA